MRTPESQIAKNIVSLYEYKLQSSEEGETRFEWLQRQIEKAVALERQHQAKLEAELASINLTLEGYKVLAGLSDPDHRKVQGMIERQLAQLKEENAVLRRLTHNDIVQQLMVANNERDAFKSELAQLKLEVETLRKELDALRK